MPSLDKLVLDYLDAKCKMLDARKEAIERTEKMVDDKLRKLDAEFLKFSRQTVEALK